MPTLSVAYANGKLTITGGDNNGSDVTVIYGQNATITWNRSGTNFKFKDLTLNPTNGPFSNKSVNDGQISIVDNDTNTTGKDVAYEYTITIKDSAGKLLRFDPKVINKSNIGLSLVERLGRAKPAKAAKKTKKTAKRGARTYR
jgi:hypothetical protein